MKNFIIDKENFNFAINSNKVIGIFAPDTPSKSGQYYIMFIIDKEKDDKLFWFYKDKKQRDYIYNNFLMPRFTFLS